MTRRFLPRQRQRAAGWAHPYGHGPFAPYLYADGGDGDGSASGAAGDPPAPAAPAAANAAPAPAPAPGQGTDDNGGDLTATVKRLEKDLADARKEAAKERTAAKQQAADAAVADLTAKLGKALGLVKDDAPADPKALADAIAQKEAALAERESALRARDVELAVWARAEKHSAKAGALLDSRSFVRAISDLDPSDKGFTTALDDAIKAAVKDNPAFGAVTVAPASGRDLSGGTGEGSAKRRSGSLSDAIRANYGT